MTREEFEAGKVFKLHHLWYKYVPCIDTEIRGYIVRIAGTATEYNANVTRIDSDSFEFGAKILNRTIDGVVLFRNCEIVEQ